MHYVLDRILESLSITLVSCLSTTDRLRRLVEELRVLSSCIPAEDVPWMAGNIIYKSMQLGAWGGEEYAALRVLTDHHLLKIGGRCTRWGAAVWESAVEQLVPNLGKTSSKPLTACAPIAHILAREVEHIITANKHLG